jgi:hypothetical protein
MRPPEPDGLDVTGRVLEQDPKSLGHPAPKAPVHSIRWAHHGPVFDQGQTRTCCSMAITQAFNTLPLFKPPPQEVGRALSLHGRTTRLDDYLENEWPEFNQGSSVLAAAKAAQEAGWITTYTWAFGLDHFKQAIQTGPLVMGTPWFTGMLEPVLEGAVRAVGEVEFWHAWVAVGYDAKRRWTIGLNSWGEEWADGGFFYVKDDSMEILLGSQYQSDALLPSAT